MLHRIFKKATKGFKRMLIFLFTTGVTIVSLATTAIVIDEVSVLLGVLCFIVFLYMLNIWLSVVDELYEG